MLCNKYLEISQKKEVPGLEKNINSIEPEIQELYNLFEEFISLRKQLFTSISKRTEIGTKIKEILKKISRKNIKETDGQDINLTPPQILNDNQGIDEIDENIEEIMNEFSDRYQDFFAHIQKTKNHHIFDEKGKEKEAVAFFILYKGFLQYKEKKSPHNKNELLAPYKVWKKISKTLKDFIIIFYRNISARKFIFFSFHCLYWLTLFHFTF
ncbi:MAG: hypothetical protein QTN59_10245 [Candidatus Electrothrix communis]|nr:MAG: hypothetical protein QTN59_10245 [Candidatus Electrothrix communis]